MRLKSIILLFVLSLVQVNGQFPITERFIDFVLNKLESSSLFDIQGFMTFGFDKTATLVDDILVKFKNILCDQIKEELKMFKIAAIIISVAILIASICCGAACLILVIKRYKVRNMYLVDLSNIRREQQYGAYKIQDSNQKQKTSYDFN